jgi:signal transduction histidine kinase
MQRMAIATHAEELEAIASTLSQDVASQDNALPLQTELQAIVNGRSSDNLWMWVRLNDKTLVQSHNFPNLSIQADLLGMTQVSSEPKIYPVDGRYVVLCRQPVPIDAVLAYFYIAKDITHDYTMVLTFTRNLGIGTVFGILILIGLSTIFIWRSLHPLRQTSQIAGLHSVKRLTKLDPNQFPGEVKALVHTYNHLLERVSQTGEQQRQFTSGVSHELRTPLSVVYGYLQSTLKRGTNLTAQQQEALQICASETERTIQLLQDLLDLARADSGIVQFDLKPLVLNDIVAGVVGMTDEFEHRMIHVEAAPEPIAVLADPHYLVQVLVHLLHNAIQFSDSQQPVSVQLSQGQGVGIIQVCDRGCGIPVTQHSRIFEPFYRVDDSRTRSTGGVGLGLAIARALVEGMGGHISVHSTPGEGSTFSVTLPTARNL